MNHAIGRKQDGSSFYMLVLEPGNLLKLQQGQPISVRVEDMFPEGIPRRLELVIIYSETPVANHAALIKEFQPEVTLDERTPVSRDKKPHCPECRSTIEQFVVSRNESPLAVVFCPACGCTLGLMPKESFAKEPPGGAP